MASYTGLEYKSRLFMRHCKLRIYKAEHNGLKFDVLEVKYPQLKEFLKTLQIDELYIDENISKMTYREFIESPLFLSNKTIIAKLIEFICK